MLMPFMLAVVADVSSEARELLQHAKQLGFLGDVTRLNCHLLKHYADWSGSNHLLNLYIDDFDHLLCFSLHLGVA